MAIAKPSAQDVIDLTGTALDESVVSSIIDDAALMVEDCVKNLSAERQEAIVKWVSAHMIASGGEGTLTSMKLGDASESYARATLGDGLSGTTYGQQALLLDPNGCLAKLGRAKATIEVV